MNDRRPIRYLFLIAFAWSALPAFAFSSSRFFLSGDGELKLGRQSIRYRSADGVYDEKALQRINIFFGARWENPEERLNLRFVEVLDYLQDQMKGGAYLLKSGYRSPRLNNSLRDSGKLAAQSSMHMEGAAGDLKLSGVDSQKVFDFVKSLDCCGIGYYHGGYFHLDTGPSRYWDEKTSKTEDKTPQENEKIILQADYDRYKPGETMTLKFMRVTNYPIGVPLKVPLVSLEGTKQGNEVRWASRKLGVSSADCLVLPDRPAARTMEIALPETGISPGSYAVKVKFCDRYGSSKMPEEILSRRFEIR